MTYNHSIGNTIGDLAEQTENLSRNHSNLGIPLKERYAAILTDDKDTARRYASFFAASRSFTNSSDFEDAVYSDMLQIGDKPLVLVSALRLPISNTGFSKALYENYEGATLASKVRTVQGYSNHLNDKDIPILLFAPSLDKDQSAHIAAVAGPLGLYVNAHCNDPKKEEIESIIFHAEKEYFRKHFEPLFKAADLFTKAYALTHNGQKE